MNRNINQIVERGLKPATTCMPKDSGQHVVAGFSPRSQPFKSFSWLLLAVLALAPTAAVAQQAAQVKTEETKKEEPHSKTEEPQSKTEEPQPKTDPESNLKSVPGGKALGMSILGNQEAPKALVIVPWKSSELGNGPSVSMLLDDSRLPVDKEVFMRMLSYYEIRSETARPGGAPTNANTAAPATAAQRRKQ